MDKPPSDETPRNDAAAEIERLFGDEPGWGEACAEAAADLEAEQREYDDTLAAIEQGLSDMRAGRHQPVAAAFATVRATAALYRELLDAFSSVEAALRWLETSVPGLSGQTPMDALRAGEIARVTGLLANVNNGMMS